MTPFVTGMGMASGGGPLTPIQSSSPAIALLASKGADDTVAAKGFVSISQLISPFTSCNLNIRDPSNALSIPTRITLDVRDLRKDGYLLSLTVLPHVLHECLVSSSSIEDAVRQFNDALAAWSEPVDQETFRSYVACLFFVSARDENPLSELSQLIQAQHSQQASYHSASDGSILGPAHCSRPLWTTPTTLKHYVVVYDSNEEQRGRDIFSQMCSTYGIDQCSQLRLDTAAPSPGDGPEVNSPDPWASRMGAYRILEQGLARARTSLLEKSQVGDGRKDSGYSIPSPTSPSIGITTISSSYSISSAASASPSTSLPPPLPPPPRVGRRNTTQADKDACQKLVDHFATNNLVPHAERLLRTLHDQVSNRRGISRSLTTGMRSLFGSRSSGVISNGNTASSAPVTFSAESQEMAQRKLADLAFLFGLYSLAYSQYQIVKKDFASDQAFLHKAMALEQSAFSLHLAQAQLTAKQFPIHYLENSMDELMKNGARWPSLLRAGLHGWRVLSHLDMHTEAASHLIRLTSIDNDGAVGVCLWLAADSFQRASMHRKAAFYRYLAGHRWGKAGLASLALGAASVAFPEYVGKEWSLAEDTLALSLASATESKLAVEAVTRLLVPSRTPRSPATSASHLAVYGRTRQRVEGVDGSSAERSVPVPRVETGATRVIFGERPLSTDLPHSADANWNDIQRAAFHAVAGISTAFRQTQVVADADTDNQKVRETPIGERFRVQLRFCNPLSVPLTLRDIRLGVGGVKMRDGTEGKDSAMEAIECRDSITLQPEENRMVELYVIPSSSVAEFRVSSVLFGLLTSADIVVPGEVALDVRGRRLNRNQKQMKSVVYAVDERLRAMVSPRRWPLVDVSLAKQPPTILFADQLVHLVLEVSNSGQEPVSSMAIAIDVVDRIAVAEEGSHGHSSWCTGLDVPGTPSVSAFPIHRGQPMAVGEKLMIHVQIRAPNTGSDFPVALLLLYRGEGGSMREWRTRLHFSLLPLLSISSRVLDPFHGLVSLHLNNEAPPSHAALARVECTRMRVAVASRARGKALLQEEHGLVALLPVGNSIVKLESGQTEELCMRIASPEEGSTAEWTMGQGERPPPWPFPVEEREDEEWGRRRMIVAIAWKATVVGNDGKVSTLVGESFIGDPFEAAGLLVPGLQLGCSLSSPGGVASPAPPPSEEEGDEVPAIYLSTLPLQPVEHDFIAGGLCEFPVTVVIRNEDAKGRSARVQIRFKPKVREQTMPPPRQQWWLSREVVEVQVEGRRTKDVSLMVRVTQPSAYDVLGAQMMCSCVMEGEEGRLPLRLPAALAVVYAKYGGENA